MVEGEINLWRETTLALKASALKRHFCSRVIGQSKSHSCRYLQVGREVQSYCVPRGKRAEAFMDALTTIHSFHLCPLLTIPIVYIKACRDTYSYRHLESRPSLSSWTKIPILRVVEFSGKAKKTALTLLTCSPWTHFSSLKY